MHEWRYLPNIGAAAQAAPSMSGIYAFGEVKRVEGLPVQIKWVYIGQAQNLKNRLSQHIPSKETNPHLRGWLNTHMGNSEVWFASVKTALLDEVERELVKIIEPKFNRIMYRGAATNENED